MPRPYKTLSIFLLLLVAINGQVGRDIAMEFLKLDTDSDYLLSSEELKHLIPDIKPGRYYTLRTFIREIYPHYFWQAYDKDNNKKISQSELMDILSEKWLKYTSSWPSDSNNLLKYLDQKQYFNVCDTNKDQQLDEGEFPACLHAVLVLDGENFPWRVKSLLYASDGVGYDYGEFKKLMVRDNVEGQAIQKYTKALFETLEWPQPKIPSDKDSLIGPQQGKIMQPIFLMIYLDRNNDGQLSKQEALILMKKHGGEEVIEIIDVDRDGKIDKYQWIGYMANAICVDCQIGADGKVINADSEMPKPEIKVKDKEKKNEKSESQKKQQSPEEL